MVRDGRNVNKLGFMLGFAGLGSSSLRLREGWSMMGGHPREMSGNLRPLCTRGGHGTRRMLAGVRMGMVPFDVPSSLSLASMVPKALPWTAVGTVMISVVAALVVVLRASAAVALLRKLTSAVARIVLRLQSTAEPIAEGPLTDSAISESTTTPFKSAVLGATLPSPSSEKQAVHNGKPVTEEQVEPLEVSARVGERPAGEVTANEELSAALKEPFGPGELNITDEQYMQLSGDEKANMLKREMRKQWKETLEERGLTEDDLGPEKLVFSPEGIRRAAQDPLAAENEADEEDERSWKSITFTIPVPMGLLEFAERLNGQLAVVGLVVCFLRQVLEPGHPLFTEQLLQAVQLVFLLPMILQSSLSNVQVDDVQTLPLSL
ncbi:hypothetical protein NDN08_005949 [Rhodosorus marinus]|uniref:Uncharacterized protein n=1 Tax=Rhodosorus marinus TaxID=101924 RepID=A0AAV8UJD9_9RHOD|nr:hypothetical protein NDN08_005949 [Rhodosorus marinus]